MNNLKLVVKNDEIPEGNNNNVKPGSNTSPVFGLSVSSFVQIISWDKYTCAVEVCQNANKQGTFYFVDGSIYNAVCGNLEGEEAFMEMISWENAGINVNNDISPNDIDKKIETELMSLLMESARRKDESSYAEQSNTSEQEYDDTDEDDQDYSETNILNSKTNQAQSNLSIPGEEWATLGTGLTKPVPGDNQLAEIKRTDEKSSKTEEAIHIVNILQNSSGILNYSIFNESDALQDKSAESTALMNFAPSLFFDLADRLSDSLLSGSTNHLTFSIAGGVHYILIRMNKSLVIVGLKPGVKPENFLNRFATA